MVTELMEPIMEETEIKHKIAQLFHYSKNTMKEQSQVLWKHATEDQTLRWGKRRDIESGHATERGVGRALW